MMFSVPEIDRNLNPNYRCLAYRKVKKSNGTFETLKVFRPEIFALFETAMGGVDMLYDFCQILIPFNHQILTLTIPLHSEISCEKRSIGISSHDHGLLVESSFSS